MEWQTDARARRSHAPRALCGSVAMASALNLASLLGEGDEDDESDAGEAPPAKVSAAVPTVLRVGACHDLRFALQVRRTEAADGAAAASEMKAAAAAAEGAARDEAGVAAAAPKTTGKVGRSAGTARARCDARAARWHATHFASTCRCWAAARHNCRVRRAGALQWRSLLLLRPKQVWLRCVGRRRRRARLCRYVTPSA